MDIPMLLAMMLGPILGLVLLQWPARRYEGVFDDVAVFTSIVFGFFAGVFVAFLHYVSLFNLAGGYAVMVFLVTLITALVNQVVLGLERFRRLKNQPIYALAFGLGVGSMVSAIILNGYFRGSHPPAGFIVVVAYSLSVILIHSAIASIFASYRSSSSVWLALAASALVLLPYNLVVFIWYMEVFLFPADVFWEIPLILLLYSGAFYYYAVRLIFMSMDKEDRRRIRRRSRRR